MAVERQYRLLRDAGYDPAEAADLLSGDPDELEALITSKPPATSTPPTPYERYVSYLPYLERRDLDETPGLWPWDRAVMAATYAQEPPPPYDPELDDFYQATVDEYLDELEAEYAEKLKLQQARVHPSMTNSQ